MLLTSLVVLLAARLLYRLWAGRCTSSRRLDGLTAIVTGSSAGIGKETAKDLAQRGARVILACRNLVKAQVVADQISSATGNQQVVVRYLDTANLTSVRAFAKEVLKTEPVIHILVNNAGIMGTPTKEMTGDGLELTMATNHYGHFLLTNLLLKRLKKSGPSRVINVASVAHMFNWNLDLKDLNFEKKTYSTLAAYAQSKLCNILFTLELAHKLQGSGVTANSLHPGAVTTEFFTKGTAAEALWKRLLRQAVNIVFKIVGKDSELGAQTSIYLAVSEEVEKVSGKYFEDCKEASASQLAKDRRLASALWEVSEAHVQLAPAETFY